MRANERAKFSRVPEYHSKNSGRIIFEVKLPPDTFGGEKMPAESTQGGHTANVFAYSLWNGEQADPAAAHLLHELMNVFRRSVHSLSTLLAWKSIFRRDSGRGTRAKPGQRGAMDKLFLSRVMLECTVHGQTWCIIRKASDSPCYRRLRDICFDTMKGCKE